MRRMIQAFHLAACGFRQWPRSTRVQATFALGFILCFLLSDKAISFAEEHGVPMQISEAFVWTFGDGANILAASLLLVLLFADMPFISSQTPFVLVRTTRATWLAGQVLYVCLATTVYMTFILASSMALCAHISFAGNQWSPTAALLGYSGAGAAISLSSSVKVMEMSTPYECMAHVYLLMLMYTLLMACLMLLANIRWGRHWGVAAAIGFSLYGLLLSPDVWAQVFGIEPGRIYKANVAVGWLSPLSQGTYGMHNFGYDLLPRLDQTYLLFGIATALLIWGALRSMRSYSFSFTGSTPS